MKTYSPFGMNKTEKRAFVVKALKSARGNFTAEDLAELLFNDECLDELAQKAEDFYWKIGYKTTP